MDISDGDLKTLLADYGKIPEAALKQAVEESEKKKESLQEVVLKRGLISEKDLTKLYGASSKIPFVELGNLKIAKEVLNLIPERVAKKYQAILFGVDAEHNYQLALADPGDLQAIDFIEKQVGSNVKVYIATQGDIINALEQYRGNLDTEITKAIRETSDAEESTEVSAKEISEDSPIAKTVNIILEYAIKAKASDVHIEPRESMIQIRYRVDGILHETMSLPRSILPAIVSRIKILANLKIDEHRIPQDGRFKVTVGSQTIALRVSTLPVMDGEKVVMRLLDEGSQALTLEELGFEGRALEIINRGITKPHGMILVTGPTGSGKSTTLYSILTILNTPEVNISTVEDPVEYRVPGVNQTQVNVKTGMTFANGLRALLRQDPNIMMVGEIRDAETADLAIQAALTGHLVLSTLHTNNAATTLPRLLDMGAEPFLIASTVNLALGQRLVRKLCLSCRIAYTPTNKEMEEVRHNFDVEAAIKYLKTAHHPTAQPSLSSTATISKSNETTSEPESKHHKEKTLEPIHDLKTKGSILDRIKNDPNIINRSLQQAEHIKVIDQEVATPRKEKSSAKVIDLEKLKSSELTLFKSGPGCSTCGTTGYQGRMGIYEVLDVDEQISKLIINRASSEDIQLQAIRNGMLTMQQDGFIKILRGLTTVEEILRVTRE